MTGNVGLTTVTTCSPSRSLRCYAHPMQTADNDFIIYLALERAYHSGQLSDRIAPRCYGAFKRQSRGCSHPRFMWRHSEWMGRTQCSWAVSTVAYHAVVSKLKTQFLCRHQVYKLVQENLHRIGISHGDLERRNIARVRGGGLYLIDFSESSRRHICKESTSKVWYTDYLLHFS